MEERWKSSGDDARDDDRDLLFTSQPGEPFDYLEVAHILPHSLNKSQSKKEALAILNMFDSGLINLIEGADIDRPRNAISLTQRYHTDFGRFMVFFEPVPDQQHTYRIDSFFPRGVLPLLPITRSLYFSKNRTIDPPLPRFLALHCAISRILHLSGAGEYIDQILRDMENKAVRADGSTELGRLVTLGLGGWLD